MPCVLVCPFIALQNVFLGIATELLKREVMNDTELDNAIDQYLVMGMEAYGRAFQCSQCGYSGKKWDVRRHIEAKHMTNTHTSCSLCGKMVKTRDSLRKHMEKDHREWKA